MDDRKMFAPLRRGDAVSAEAKVIEILSAQEAGATAARLADEFFRRGLALGTRGPLTKRLEGLLGELEQAAKVERIPDGRYRAVRTRRA